jgi:hypothetical protein
MDERRVPEALLACYVATLLGPAALLWGRETGQIALPGAVAAALAAGLASALAARTVDDLIAALASWWVAALTVVPPLAYLPYMIVATGPGSADALVAVVGLLAVVPGIGVPVSAAVVRNRRLRTGATEIAVVTVGGDDDAGGSDNGIGGGRNWPVIAVAVVFGVAMVAVGAFVAFTDSGDFGSLTTALGSLSTVLLLFANDDETELAVTDAGLRVDRSMTDWDAFEGYRVTDDQVELVRPGWYRPTRSFERSEISDEDALVEALAEFLPRLDEHGRVEMAARRGTVAQ